MDSKKIRIHNDKQFLIDIKSVRNVVVDLKKTDSYMGITKKEVLHAAESTHIFYYMSDDVFVVKRKTMVIF